MTQFLLSKPLRIGVSAICLSATLMMGACGPKDKGAERTISAEKAPLGLSSLSDKDFARHFSVPKRKISTAESQNALAKLGLAESNENGLSWQEQSGSNGSYTFTNMKSTSDDGTVSIGKAELFGIHMDGDQATFDRADFGDVTLISEDVTIKVDSMSLARPTADTAKAIVKSLENLANDIDLDFGDETDFGFGAISMKSVDIKADEVTGTIEQIVWGTDEDTKRADIKIENVDFNIPQDGSDISSLLTLKNLSARGYNVKDISKGFAAGTSGDPSGLSSLLMGFNAYEVPYDTVTLEGFKFDGSAVNIDLPKIEAESHVKNDVTTITQVLAPMTVKMNESISGNARQAYDILQQLGFDTMTFESSQTTILNKKTDTMEVKDGIFEMDEGFRLNYKYGASGLQALADTQTGGAEQLTSALDKMKINGMTLSLEDKSIVERGLKLAAQMRGKDANRVKQEMRAALTLAPLAARNDLEKDIISQFGGAFMDFIDNSGTLTVQIAPQNPIALSSLNDVENITPEDLGFSARQDN